MMKKIIALMMVLLMVFPLLASCKKDGAAAVAQGMGANDHLGPNGETLSEEEAAYNKSIREYVNGLAEDNNFNGKTFTWVGGGSQAPTKDELMGDILSDALYYRQRDIEGAFGITWSNYKPEQLEGSSNHAVVDAVMQDVLASGGAYDAGYGTPVAVCQPMFIQDGLADISTFGGLDFEQDWWPDSLLDTYHINGALYFINGPIVTSFYNDAHSVIYNKKVADNYNVPDLYELVANNEWTFDKMLEIGEVIPVNTSGSGAYRFSEPNGIAILYANGVTVTKFNDDMTPYVPDKYPEEVANLSAKFAPIFGNDAITANTKGAISGNYESFMDKYGYESENDMFIANNLLFSFKTTGDAAELRTEDVTFGILPLPKGSAEQENYYSYAEPWSAFNVFVPKSASDTDYVGVILEAMAAFGRRYIKPAYYDNLLRSRATYDYESQDMLDIIFESKVYDIIDFIAVGGSNNEDSAYVKILKACIQETSDGISSKYDMQARLVKRNIDTILKDMEERG